MKVTVTEAMRLKNEISRAIQVLQASMFAVNMGVVTESGQEVINDTKPFPEYLTNLQHMLDISEELNSKLAMFNVVSGISDKVRSKANYQMLIQVFEQALSQYKPARSSKYEVVGAQRVEVVSTFSPFMSKVAVRSEIKICKTKMRELQQEIEKLNTKEIEFSFEYDDIVME